MKVRISSISMLYLAEVADAGSIRLAAERLFISPSALNRKILLLEEQLGTAIFKRAARGVTLTGAGEIMLAAARQSERNLAAAISQVEALRGLKRGHVNFGTLTGFAEKAVPELLTGWRVSHPEVTFNYYAGNSRDIVQQVLEGRLELGLCWDPPSSTPVRRLASADIPIGIAMRPDHPLAARKKVRLRECLQYAVVFPSRGMEFRTVLERINIGIESRVTPAIEVNSIAALRQLALIGRDLVLITANSVMDEIEAGTVVLRPLEDPGCDLLKLTLFTKDSDSLPAVADVVIAGLERELETVRARIAAIAV